MFKVNCEFDKQEMNSMLAAMKTIRKGCLRMNKNKEAAIFDNIFCKLVQNMQPELRAEFAKIFFE